MGEKKMTLRKAANEMCKNCVYDKAEKGTWREQVEACNCVTCPLYAHRPLSGEGIKARRLEKAQGKTIPVALAA